MSSTSVNLGDFPSVFDAKTCIRRGLCPVTTIRPQGPELLESHSLYFEQHGRGKNKIVSIMGLNSTSFSWLYQVRYFGASGFKNERREEEMKGPASALKTVTHAKDEEDASRPFRGSSVCENAPSITTVGTSTAVRASHSRLFFSVPSRVGLTVTTMRMVTNYATQQF